MLPADGTQSIGLFDGCSGKPIQSIAIHVTISSIPSRSAQHGVYEVAHVKFGVGGRPLAYGPLDFRFVGKDGRTYRPIDASAPGDSSNAFGVGTLVSGELAEGDVTFDVPPGGGAVTFAAQFGGSTVSWATSS